MGLDHLHHVGRDLIRLLEAADVQRQQNLLILSEPNVKGQKIFRPLRTRPLFFRLTLPPRRHPVTFTYEPGQMGVACGGNFNGLRCGLCCGRVKLGVDTGLCADPLLHQERRSGHVIHTVLDIGVAVGGPSDDANHGHLREEENRSRNIIK